MARLIEKLTPMAVSKAKAPGYIGDGAGLWLRVSPSLSKSWIFRYTKDRKAKVLSLGSCITVGLKEAREKAKQARLLLQEGTDPVDTRKEKVKAVRKAKTKAKTFSECVDLFLGRKTFNNVKHGKQWRSTLKEYAYPRIGDLLVSEIDISDIKEVLDPIWQTKTETASRVQGRIKKVIDYAIVSGYREKSNPAIWTGYLDSIFDSPKKVKSVVHMDSIPYSKVYEFMQALHTHEAISAKALEFLILTAVRSDSVRSATWSQIDKKARVWTVPKAFTKTKRRDHAVPLSNEAMVLLESLKEFDETDLLFPSPTLKKMSDSTISKLMREMRDAKEFKGEGVPHGFRSTFSTWRLEQTTYSQELGEYALMHEVGDSVYKAYQRSDGLEKRRAIMQDWATFINTPYVEVKTADNVVDLKSKRTKA
jgi:integrase